MIIIMNEKLSEVNITNHKGIVIDSCVFNRDGKGHKITIEGMK